MRYFTDDHFFVIRAVRFALTWLSVMTLFPISLLLLKFNRGRIPRTHTASLPLTLLAALVALVVFAGNVAIDPKTVGYFAAYALAIMACFLATNKKVHLIRWMYWAYDQTPLLHRSRWLRRKSDAFVRALRKLKRQPVCVLTNTDEVCSLEVVSPWMW